MKVGDLVRLKPQSGRWEAQNLGLGLVISVEREFTVTYAWVLFQGWPANEKWIEGESLEVISESW